jgi:homoserine O-acetyltransferase
MDYFDIERSYGPMNEAFREVNGKYLLVSYSSDWLFTTEQSKDVVRALLYNDKDVSFIEIDSPYGHDAFLIESVQLSKIITPFLESMSEITN